MRLSEISPIFTKKISDDEIEDVIPHIIHGSTVELAVYVSRLSIAIERGVESPRTLCESWFYLEMMKNDLLLLHEDVSHSEKALKELLHILINSGCQKILNSL